MKELLRKISGFPGWILRTLTGLEADRAVREVLKSQRQGKADKGEGEEAPRSSPIRQLVDGQVVRLWWAANVYADALEKRIGPSWLTRRGPRNLRVAPFLVLLLSAALPVFLAWRILHRYELRAARNQAATVQPQPTSQGGSK